MPIIQLIVLCPWSSLAKVRVFNALLTLITTDLFICTKILVEDRL